jgi:hypothetical protein
MLECLYCEARYDSNEIRSLYYPTVYCPSIGYERTGSTSFICPNGHLVGVLKKGDQPFTLYEKEWYPGILGSLSHLRIFDFKDRLWCTTKISLNKYSIREYKSQQSQLKYETSVSRLEWLKCAVKLEICKNVRLLIGKYINREPREFWKSEISQNEQISRNVDKYWCNFWKEEKSRKEEQSWCVLQ